MTMAGELPSHPEHVVMKNTSWLNLILWSVLTIPGLISGRGGRSISFLVTRPAEINLSEYNKITIGDIKGSGSGFVSKLSDLGTFLQVWSPETPGSASSQPKWRRR